MREFLYPLGFAASFLFGLRFYIQWYLSERMKKTYSGVLFWSVSISAHAILALHGFIQLQYAMVVIQTLNAVICFRNIQLIKNRHCSVLRVFLIMGVASLLATSLYLLQAPFTPHFSWTGSSHFIPTHLSWHLFGLFGMALFASRFWLQWWQSEKTQTSHLSPSFFWISLIGSVTCLIYFVKLWDLVNILSYGLGLGIYVRNLILISKRKVKSL